MRTKIEDILKKGDKTVVKPIYLSKKHWPKIKKPRTVLGLILNKVCKCKNYQPVSSSGIIILRCRHCGGTKQVKTF